MKVNFLQNDNSTYRLTKRKHAILKLSNRLAMVRDEYIARNSFYYEDEKNYMRFLIPEGKRILELGCGSGNLLANLKPSYGIGIDISPQMVSKARSLHPDLEFLVGDIENPQVLSQFEVTFDAIIISDTIGFLEDCQGTLNRLHKLCTNDTRVIIAYYSSLWEPILRLSEKLRLKMPSIEQNWLSTDDTINFCYLSDFEVIKREWRLLFPKSLLGLGKLINRYIGTLPVIRRLCLRNYIVARSIKTKAISNPSVSIVIPCRNEQGHIEQAIKRIPQFCDNIEIIFFEGHSRDDTWNEIQRIKKTYNDSKIQAYQQGGIGKADAVWKGFDKAEGDLLMILDADLTVPPEILPLFYDTIANGKGDFAMGSRLIYPTEKMAMRFLNFWANNIFAALFTWLLNQRITDTLCGTKVLRKVDFNEIYANKSYFGNADPFGDFDLIFGAAKANLKIIEVPIRYKAREYGETQISRFRHGWKLLKMVVFAYRKLKAF